MQREFIEGNRLIARFLGFIKHDYLWRPPFGNTMGYPKIIFEGDNTDSFKFHSSWDWLMPVVKKCHNIDAPTNKGWSKADRIENRIPANAFEMDNIALVWQAVIEFIEWYNSKQLEN